MSKVEMNVDWKYPIVMEWCIFVFVIVMLIFSFFTDMKLQNNWGGGGGGGGGGGTYIIHICC